MAIGPHHRQTGYSDRLAPEGLPPILDLESPSRTGWTAVSPKDVRDRDSPDERGEPALGAPRIHSELLKLGIDIGETSVGKYMLWTRKPPSQTGRTFLKNHVKTMDSMDFFKLP